MTSCHREWLDRFCHTDMTWTNPERHREDQTGAQVWALSDHGRRCRRQRSGQAGRARKRPHCQQRAEGRYRLWPHPLCHTVRVHAQKLSVPVRMSRLVSYFSLTLLFTLCACFVDYASVIVVIKESENQLTLISCSLNSIKANRDHTFFCPKLNFALLWI